MPPEERFVPRFAAEPPQELLPYGRWAERLGEEFLRAASDLEDVGEPGELRFYPDRTWHGRTWVPITAPTSDELELFGFVSFRPARDGGEPSAFNAVADPRAAAGSRARSTPAPTPPRRRPPAIRSGSSTSTRRSSGCGAARRARRPR